MTRTYRKEASIVRCTLPKRLRKKKGKNKKGQQHHGKNCWICW